MPRLTPIDPTTATGQAKELLDGVEAALGMTPNMARTMAKNPAVLKGWIELNSALSNTLTRELNEQLSIAIAEQNECGYCLSAHTMIGGLVGLDENELELSRGGESADAKVAAALKFAQTVNAKRGDVSDEDLARVRAAGYDDGDIAAIVAHVGLNVLTNYFNLVAQTVIDFPEVRPGLAKAA
jgi:AhpD family alkylhydroperoxidase